MVINAPGKSDTIEEIESVSESDAESNGSSILSYDESAIEQYSLAKQAGSGGDAVTTASEYNVPSPRCLNSERQCRVLPLWTQPQQVSNSTLVSEKMWHRLRNSTANHSSSLMRKLNEHEAESALHQALNPVVPPVVEPPELPRCRCWQLVRANSGIDG